MAPIKKVRTYSGANNSVANNSIDAFNLLFAKNKAKRIIGRGKKKTFLIKELPLRKRCESVLANDSFDISTNDTFDKLYKQPEKPPKNIHTYSAIEDTYNSPIMTRQRKKYNFDSSSSLKISEITDSFENTNLKRLKEPSEERIEESLEVERVSNKPNTSLSYIKVPNHLNYSKVVETTSLSYNKMANSFDGVKASTSVNNFTKKLGGKFLTNCSTPVANFKNPKLINHTISPVKMDFTAYDKSELANSNFSTNVCYANKNMTDVDLNSLKMLKPSIDFKGNNDTPEKRNSFITLRKRKILKSKLKSRKKDVSKSIRTILTASLDSNFLEKQNNVFTSLGLSNAIEKLDLFDNSNKKHYSLKDFETIEKLYFSDMFVTKRKSSKETSNCLNPIIQNKNLKINLKRLPLQTFTCLESSFESFFNRSISTDSESPSNKENHNSLPILDNLKVNLERISYLEPNFESFYSKRISIELENPSKKETEKSLDPENEMINISEDTKNGDSQDKTNHLESPLQRDSCSVFNFESFYSKRISKEFKEIEESFCLEDEMVNMSDNIKMVNMSDNIENKDLLYTNKKSLQLVPENKIKNINTQIINISDSMENNDLQDYTNKKSLQLVPDNDIKHIHTQMTNITDSMEIKDLHNNTCKKYLQLKQKNKIIENINTQVYTKQMSNRKNSNSVSRKVSNDSTFKNSTRIFEHKTADYKELIVSLVNFNFIEKTKPYSSNLQNKVKQDTTQLEHFEMFCKDNYDTYNFPLPTIAVEVPKDKDSFNSSKESLDIIDSSYIMTPVPVKNKQITKKKSAKSTATNIDQKTAGRKNEFQIINESSILNTFQKSINTSSAVNDPFRCPDLDKDGFKMPEVPTKRISLKGGKDWKRSFSLYKRNSVCYGFSNEDCRSSYLAKFSSKGKLNRLSTLGNNQQLSVRLIPTKPIIDLEKGNSNLFEYALNSSYVSEHISNDTLENSFKCLSLSQRNSLNNKSQLNELPVTAKEIVLRRCGQTEPLDFSKCFPDSVLQHCQKIGEGVYGEVFLFRNPKGGTSVIKIVPVEGDLIVNGERQKKFDEVLSEIIITMELSNLRNNQRNGINAFTEVQKIQCVQGKYPEKLLILWDEFDETKHSENDCPDIFGEDQLYIIFQMAYAGKDLESYEFNNAMQAFSMFKQVAIGLAIAEEELKFEHRDLHWGNVLIAAVESNKTTSFHLDNETYEMPTMGVQVAIIDFTLSRIEQEGVVIFNDLGLDPDLFTAEGDYQFEIYRLMQQKNRNNWKEFEPFTNLLWLDYILYKIISGLRYKNTKTKRHKEYLRKIKMLQEDILRYHNVKDFVIAKLV